jgi:hypothetical protein
LTSGGRVSAGLALFAALAVGAFAAAAIVVREKTPNLALEVLHLDCQLTPKGADHQVAHIRFFTRYSDPHARVTIVGEALSPARTLEADVRLEANKHVKYEWDGRTDAGALAPPGRYALRVNLPSRYRNMLWVAKRIHLDSGGCSS